MAEIVRTPDVLGGFPRLAGRRIGVHHVLGKLEAHDDVEEAAKRLDITPEEVRAAVEYAEAHPDVMTEVRRKCESSLERVREQAEYPEGVKPSNG